MDNSIKEQKMRKRGGRRKSKTLVKKHLNPQEYAEILEVEELLETLRPKTRADCINGARPCIWVSCKYNLYLDINPKTHSIRLNFPDKEIWELEETCVLDVADGGPVTLERVGEIMNLTRERIRQLEASVAKKLRQTRLALEYYKYIMGKKLPEEEKEE